MTRKKISLAFITNDQERKASFKKRKKGLVKKVSELSTLCDVEACAIIYSPFEEDPEVWPSRQGVQAVLARYMNMPHMDQTRKMVNQESFTRQRIKKAVEQFQRIQKENNRKELEIFMYQCIGKLANMDNFDVRDAVEMRGVVNQALRTINSKIEALKIEADQQNRAPQGPQTNEDNIESFPWNLVDSPTRLGWDDVLPQPYTFNNGSPQVSPMFGINNLF